MGIAEDMGRLAEEIITSYDVRVKALGDLVADTRKTVKGFTANRKKMASEQAENLAKFARDLAKSAGNMLEGFRRSHKEMSDEQAKSLADFVTGLAEDVGSMVSGFAKARGKMSKELKDRLVKGVREIETHVKKRLREFDEAHAEMSDALKKSLSRYVGDIVSSVKKLLGEARDIVGEYSSESAKAKKAWKSMSSAMAKARETGVVPRIEVGRKVTPIKKAKPKKKTKENQILAIVRENPDGVTLPEIAYTMGVPFVSLAKAIKNLQAAKKVRKREKLYFPK